jgi:hypothetical protein
MSFKRALRRLLLAFVLGGHPVFGIGMSREKIEELMCAMNQTRVELTIPEDEGEGNLK